MGVNGLTSILKKEKYVEHVNISQLKGCDKPFSKSLAIDGNGLMYYLLDHYNLEWRLGTCSGELLRAVNDFLKKFLQHSIKCVIMMDGVIEPRKEETVNERVLDRSRRVQNFISHPTGRHEKKLKSELFFKVFTLAIKYLAHLKPGSIEFIACSIEADPFIAHYASTHEECLGVLARDSDFCVFKNVVYFPFSSLKITQAYIKVRRHDSTKLGQILGVTSEQLAMVACHMGTDHCSSHRLGSNRDESFELALKSVKEVNSDDPTEIQEYFSKYWEDLSGPLCSMRFYLDLNPYTSIQQQELWDIWRRDGEDPPSEVSDEEKQIYDLVQRRIEAGLLMHREISFMFSGVRFLAILHVQPEVYDTIWKRTRYIRSSLYKWFDSCLAPFNGTVNELLPMREEIKSIPCRISDIPSLSMKPLIELFKTYSPSSPIKGEWSDQAHEFVSFMDTDGMDDMQKGILLAFILTPANTREETLSAWGELASSTSQAKWFTLIMVVMHKVEPFVKEIELRILCCYYYLSVIGTKGPSYRQVIFNKHAKRCRQMHTTLEASIHEISTVAAVLGLPIGEQIKFVKWLNPLLFFQVYYKTCAGTGEYHEHKGNVDALMNKVKSMILFEEKKETIHPNKKVSTTAKHTNIKGVVQKPLDLKNAFSSLSLSTDQ